MRDSREIGKREEERKKDSREIGKSEEEKKRERNAKEEDIQLRKWLERKGGVEGMERKTIEQQGKCEGGFFASLKWAAVKNPEQISRASRERRAIVNCQRPEEAW